MDSSRDSSVWQSLAVTFGGGLALGAVAMKLSQTTRRPEETPPPPEPNILTDRLATMERRLERVEQTPVAARPPVAPPAAAVPIDQKVLEAVIGAVDARLHEQAGQMERRLADLEARLAVEVQALHRQDRHAVESGEQGLAEIRKVSDRLSQALTGQAAIHSEMQALHQQSERLVDAAEQRFDDMRLEYRQAMNELRDGVKQAISGEKAARDHELAELRASLEQSIETRIITAAAAAAANQFDEQLAPLRAEVRRKEQELAELRRRLAESENSVFEVISSIGDVCRQAAERHRRADSPTAPPSPEASAPPMAPEVNPPAAAGPEPAALTTAETMPGPVAVPAVETLPAPQLAADPSLARAIPDFLHENDRVSTWRIPLVSSLLVCATTGCLFLLHYL